MYCGLFAKIPDATLERIQTMAQSIAARIQSGEMSPADLSPEKLTEIGQDVVDGLSEEEIKAFTDNILSDPSALQELASSLTGGVGGDPMALATALMGSGGGGGNPMALAMQMMSGMTQQEKLNKCI